MGLDILGWVEIFSPNLKNGDGIAEWQGVIRVQPVIKGLRDRQMWQFLFGGWGEHLLPLGTKPVTTGRSTPDNLSNGAKSETYLRISAWILWSEIKQAGYWMAHSTEYSDFPDLSSEWFHLFKMMSMLAETYDDENVRLSVGFD